MTATIPASTKPFAIKSFTMSCTVYPRTSSATLLYRLIPATQSVPVAFRVGQQTSTSAMAQKQKKLEDNVFNLIAHSESLDTEEIAKKLELDVFQVTDICIELMRLRRIEVA